MLELNDIKKTYDMGETKVEALKGISLNFRDSEFVSILGASGCGKTTLLNIVGGLDKYTNGDLIIDGKSTKEYKDKDWDNYRNNSVGFVFQSYNLIPHQTILENVELALTLSGVKKAERRERAKRVLEKVGLTDKLNSKPNQLSGGQMQRVAIARALVNNPEIILADEPTGALDTQTSVQVMELLKEVAKERLVIMVTHNPELAENYSSRIIRMKDGLIEDDSNQITTEEFEKISKKVQKNTKKAQKLQKMSKSELKEFKKQQKLIKRAEKKKVKKMSFWTALSLSFKNLLTKKARTMLVSFAGSIGIFGIALILALSSGFQTYINKTQENTLSTYPITINSKSVDFSSVVMSMFADNSLSNNVEHPKDAIYVKENISKMMNDVGSTLGTNNLEKFNKHITEHYEEIEPYVNAIQYTYDLDFEFYENGAINDFYDIKEINASNAIMDMIIKYSLNFFQKKTNISFEEHKNGSYTLIKLENLEGYTLAEKYPFVYENNYSNLYDIIEKLDADGTYLLKNQLEVLKLVFTIMDLGMDPSSIGSGGMSSMLFSKNIFSEMLDNEDLIKSQYTLLGNNSKFMTYDAEHSNEALLVLDKNNELDDYLLFALGLITHEQMNSILEGLINGEKRSTFVSFDSIIGTEFKVLDEADYYVEDDGNIVDFRTFATTENLDLIKYATYYQQAVANSTNKLKIVGVVRLNDEVSAGSLKEGIVYSKYFTDKMIDYHNTKINSFSTIPVGLSQINKEIPSTISLYINSFESKESIKRFIDSYNENAEKNDKITYTDTVGLIMSAVSTIINAITYVLIAFVSISLIVSSIMIGIITYISVLERTKEIGVLRSVGASKGDIKLVFTAESLIIGFVAGLLGIFIALLLTIPVNVVINSLAGIGNVASLPWLGGILLVSISMILTFIAGLVPARIASKKDPVECLRTE